MTPPLHIGGNDVGAALKVAAYVGVSAVIASLASQISGMDFSSVAVYGINGQVIATAVVNVLVYLGKLYASDTK